MLKNIILANAANATFNKKWAKDNGITMPEGFNWTHLERIKKKMRATVAVASDRRFVNELDKNAKDAPILDVVAPLVSSYVRYLTADPSPPAAGGLPTPSWSTMKRRPVPVLTRRPRPDSRKWFRAMLSSIRDAILPSPKSMTPPLRPLPCLPKRPLKRARASRGRSLSRFRPLYWKSTILTLKSRLKSTLFPQVWTLFRLSPPTDGGTPNHETYPLHPLQPHTLPVLSRLLVPAGRDRNPGGLESSGPPFTCHNLN